MKAPWRRMQRRSMQMTTMD
jgi:colicin import membrane protein